MAEGEHGIRGDTGLFKTLIPGMGAGGGAQTPLATRALQEAVHGKGKGWTRGSQQTSPHR